MRIAVIIFVAAATLLSASIATADTITVDQNLWQPEVVNPGVLKASVDMSFNAALNQLTIELTNVSTALAVDVNGDPTASALLTGLGFVLPDTIAIAGGSVSMAGSTRINWTLADTIYGDDVSMEWGFDNKPLKSGVLMSMSDFPLTTGVSTMESGSDTKFAPGNIHGANFLNGPDFGLYSHTAVLAGPVGGVKGIDDSVVITLSMAGSYTGTTSAPSLLDYIESNHVVATWGSPAAGDTVVPEPGSLALLGFGVLALAIHRRRRKQ